MSKTISGESTYSNNLTIGTNSDLADETLFEVPYQRLISNDRFIYDQMNAAGVRAVKTVSTITDLQALGDLANGQTCIVTNLGVYTYVDPDNSSEDLPHKVAPSVGTGRWHSSLLGLRNVPGGFPYLNGSSKIPFAQVQNAIVSLAHSASTAIQNIPSTNNTPATGTAVTVTGLQPGDLVLLIANAKAELVGSTPGGYGGIYIYVTVGIGGTPVQIPNASAAVAHGELSPTTKVQLYSATTSGTHSFQIYASYDEAATSIRLSQGTNLTALVVRP